jgi:hypothetical protein
MALSLVLVRFALVVRSRQVRIAGVARTHPAWFGPGAVRLQGVQLSLSIDCRYEPARAVLAIELASPARCPVLSPRRHRPTLFLPSVGCAPKEEGTYPRAVNQIGTRPPSRWGNARRSTAPAPQSKPVTPASRLVAHVAPSVASGRGLRILAAGPARARLYSSCGQLCAPTQRRRPRPRVVDRDGPGSMSVMR